MTPEELREFRARISAELREIRAKLGKDQDQMGVLLGVGGRAYRHWEGGTRTMRAPLLNLARQLAAALPK